MKATSGPNINHTQLLQRVHGPSVKEKEMSVG